MTMTTRPPLTKEHVHGGSAADGFGAAGLIAAEAAWEEDGAMAVEKRGHWLLVYPIVLLHVYFISLFSRGVFEGALLTAL